MLKEIEKIRKLESKLTQATRLDRALKNERRQKL